MKFKNDLIIQLILLCLVIGLVYSPAFHAEPCLLDDVNMLKGLQGEALLDLKSLLPPSFPHITYYRPLIGISYWCAQTLWNAAPQAMHIENVVFHLLNVVLLFWLIRLSLPNGARSGHFVPFLGALLFAVHPIAAESVNWISGRSDLIAGMCLLSATVALLAWRRKRSCWWLMLLGLMLATGGILTKEAAWGFLAVLPLLLADPYDSTTHPLLELYGRFTRLEKLMLLTAVSLCFLLAVVLLTFWPVIALSTIFGLIVLYRKLRRTPLSRQTSLLIPGLLILIAAVIPFCVKLAKQSASSGSYYSSFSRTVLLISLDFDNSIGLFSAAIAFYIKKFFLPLPLSFSITDIAPGYLFAGIAVIILTAFLIAWRSQAAILFLTGLALLLPALPLVHNQIAWSPYAERYIYISSAFWIASLAVASNAITRPSLRVSCATMCMTLIPIAALISYKRSVLWQSNVTLFEDTVRKSPSHLEARVLYMTALSKAGKLSEALGQYKLIKADPSAWKRVTYFFDFAELLYKHGLMREAWDVLDTSLAIPLPLGQKHPLHNDDWQRLYKLHSRLRQELFPN